MSVVKNILKKFIGKENLIKFRHSQTLKNVGEDNKIDKIKSALCCFFKVKIYDENTKGKSLKKLLSNLEIEEIEKDRLFYYYIDIFKTNLTTDIVLGNFSVDYSYILNNSLNDLKRKINKSDENFYNNIIDTIDGIEIYIDNILKKVDNEKITDNIKRIKEYKANSFHEALQRILFFNSLLWQTNFERKLNRTW